MTAGTFDNAENPRSWFRTGSELAPPAAVAISLFLSCILISRKKAYWFDELFSLYVIGEPHLGEMYAAFADKINNTPFLYFILGWAWSKAFGTSELALRLFSSAGMALAAFVIWRILRRYHSYLRSTVVLLAMFGLSVPILEQNAEARMYGLFLAVVAIAVDLHLRIEGQTSLYGSAVAWLFLAHAAILNTHLYGIFFSFALVLFSLVDCWQNREKRNRLMTAVACAWMTLIFYYPAFVVQADAGVPRSWIPPPTLGDLIAFYTYDTRYLSALVAISVIWWACNNWNDLNRPLRSNLRLMVDRPDLRIAVLLLALPVGVWLLSLSLKPVFFFRYMLGSLIGYALVLAAVLPGNPRSLRPGGILLAVAACAGFLAAPIYYARAKPASYYIGRFDHEIGEGDVRIVIPFANSFLQRIQYSPSPRRYVYVLDWDAAISPDSGTFPPQEYKHMEALRARFPYRFGQTVITSVDFLRDNQDFLIVVDPDYHDRKCLRLFPWNSLKSNLDWNERLQCPQFINTRVLGNPEYNVQFIKRLTDTTLVFRVKRTSLVP